VEAGVEDDMLDVIVGVDGTCGKEFPTDCAAAATG